jgi:hypothetical protein
MSEKLFLIWQASADVSYMVSRNPSTPRNPRLSTGLHIGMAAPVCEKAIEDGCACAEGIGIR